MVSRHFATLGDRSVFYRRHGTGAPALLIHSSPASSEFLLPAMQALERSFTCFAPDSPGFGDSDPLALDSIGIADMADAVADFVLALGLGPLPVFGTHTGACVALELAYRHPDLVTGLVLDGLPLFTEAECDDLLPGYLMAVEPSELGGHFSAIWTRLRDQFIWFPWTRRHPSRHMTGTIEGGAPVQRWMMMMLRAGNAYRGPYEAAWRYAPDAMRALSGLIPPALFFATGNDMLFPHLDRFPALRGNQHILRLPPNDTASYMGAIRDGMLRFATGRPAPEVPPARLEGTGLRRLMVGAAGAQYLVRAAHVPGTRPLLLLHDLFRSSWTHEPGLRAAHRTIVAPDLPGCGDSDPLAEQPSVAGFASSLLCMLDALGLDGFDVEAHGWSAAIALALAEQAGPRIGAVRLRGTFPATGVDPDLLAPELVIETQGTHWYKTWAMLRDGEVYAPWYVTRQETLRRTEGTFDADTLHRWTVELMKQPLHYRDLLVAVHAVDLDAAIARHTGKLLRD